MGRKKLELHEANHNAMADRKSVRESIYSQPQWPALGVHPTKNTLSVVPWEIATTQNYSCYSENHNNALIVGPLSRVRPRRGNLAIVVVVVTLGLSS